MDREIDGYFSFISELNPSAGPIAIFNVFSDIEESSMILAKSRLDVCFPLSSRIITSPGMELILCSYSCVDCLPEWSSMLIPLVDTLLA